MRLTQRCEGPKMERTSLCSPALCLGVYACDCLIRLRRRPQLLPVIRLVQHFAGVTAVVGTDDAVFGHVVDEAGGAAVADAERALQQRDAAAAFADDDFDSRFV